MAVGLHSSEGWTGAGGPASKVATKITVLLSQLSVTVSVCACGECKKNNRAPSKKAQRHSLRKTSRGHKTKWSGGRKGLFRDKVREVGWERYSRQREQHLCTMRGGRVAAAGASLPGSNAHLLPPLASVSSSINGDNNSPYLLQGRGDGGTPGKARS